MRQVKIQSWLPGENEERGFGGIVGSKLAVVAIVSKVV